ncbi:MAG: hypothetical protein R3D59_12145 [Paracoccaceae bacterium]
MTKPQAPRTGVDLPARSRSPIRRTVRQPNTSSTMPTVPSGRVRGSCATSVLRWVALLRDPMADFQARRKVRCAVSSAGSQVLTSNGLGPAALTSRTCRERRLWSRVEISVSARV